MQDQSIDEASGESFPASDPPSLVGASVGTDRPPGPSLRDPRTACPRPPFPVAPISPPGSSGEMRPVPDHGEATYHGRERLRDYRALITGGDSGIGRAVAIAYAREGADVVISYLSEHDDAASTAECVRAAGRTAVLVPGDIGDPATCAALVERTVDEMGGLDILVNNAAFQRVNDGLLDTPPEEIEEAFRTNILAQFWMCREAVPHMAPGSAIINTTSIQSYQPRPGLIHYASSKGAVTTFTKALAKDVIESHGIRVNGVAPGPVWTPLVASTFRDHLEDFGGNTPIGRPAQPAELAPLYVFLASDESRYIIGEIIGATGGREIS
jgi:NAD(P)-dependent dehydrogenase (short-subunit alcohol dehydrogenase family)